MSLKELWSKDEAAKNKEKAKEQIENFIQQDFVSEARRMVGGYQSLVCLLNESISRMWERIERLEQGVNQEPQYEDDESDED